MLLSTNPFLTGELQPREPARGLESWRTGSGESAVALEWWWQRSLACDSAVPLLVAACCRRSCRTCCERQRCTVGDSSGFGYVWEAFAMLREGIDRTPTMWLLVLRIVRTRDREVFVC